MLVLALPYARHAYQLEMGGRALEQARLFAEENPKAPNPHLNQALQSLHRAVETGPEDGYAYRRLGQAYLLLGDILRGRGDIEQARWAYQRCIDIDPKGKAGRESCRDQERNPAGAAALGIGSKLISKDLVAKGDFAAIAEKVKQTLAFIQKAKSAR